MNKKNNIIKVTVTGYKNTRYDLKSRTNSSQERCSSIRKSYLNKNNNYSNNFNENKITSKLINFNNSISAYRKLKENNHSEILPYQDNKKTKSIIHIYEGSILKGSVNQNEPSFNNNKKKRKGKKKNMY